MQSSTAIAFRALVMLIILISVPLFALFGKDLPDVIKGVLDGRGLVLGPPKDAANSEGAATPTAPTTRWSDSGPYHGASPPSRLDAAGPPTAASTPSTMDSPRGMASPTSAGALPRSAGPSAIALAEPAVPGSAVAPGALAEPVAPSGTVSQAGGQSAPIEWHTGPAVNAEWGMGNGESGGTAAQEDGPARLAGPGGANPTPDGEQFRWAERRLRELGATHYMLETWGPENNRYRFVCQMAIGGNPGVNRYFQAIDDDPWQAMEGVLKQVEAWRSQGLQ